MLVEHCAVRVFPLPDSATAEHALIDAPLSVKAIVPVGAFPLIVAVNVTDCPVVDGLTELATVVVVATLVALTTCERLLVAEVPDTVATMVCVPSVSELAEHVALPPVLTVTPVHNAAPLLVKFTPAFRGPLVTVAVNVTVAPCSEGFSELTRLTVVPVVLTVCDTLPLLALLFASPA